MAGGETQWSADVPVSMPKPTGRTGVDMQGFIFTSGGMAHDIPLTEYARMSTPDWAPTAAPTDVVYEDSDLDEPPSSMVTL